MACSRSDSTVTISTTCSDLDLPPSYRDSLITPQVRVVTQDSTDGNSPPPSWLRYKWQAAWHCMKVNNNLHKICSLFTLFLVLILFTINHRRGEDRHSELYKHVNNLDQHVETLTQKMNTIEKETIAKIDNVYNNISTLNEQTVTLESLLSDLSDHAANMEKVVKETKDEMNNKINHIYNKTANLDTQIADIIDRTDTMLQMINQMKEKMEGLKNEISETRKTLRDKLGSHFAQQGNRADNMEQLVRQMKKQMLDKIKDLQNEINTLKEEAKKGTAMGGLEPTYVRRMSSYTNFAATSHQNVPTFMIIMLSVTFYLY